MQWAISKSHESIGERGEKLLIKDVEGLGDKAVIGGERTRVGAGGMGMGVKLARSDEKDQTRNKMMLEDFLKREEKKRRKQERLKKNFEKEKEGEAKSA